MGIAVRQKTGKCSGNMNASDWNHWVRDILLLEAAIPAGVTPRVAFATNFPDPDISATLYSPA